MGKRQTALRIIEVQDTKDVKLVWCIWMSSCDEISAVCIFSARICGGEALTE